MNLNYTKILMITALLFGTSYAAEKSSTKETKHSKYYAHDENLTDDDVVKFLDNLKEALRNDNMEKFSEYISYKYPLSCKVNGKKNHTLKSKKQFLKEAKTILTPEIKKAILDASVDDDDLLVNCYGIGIGHGRDRGALWFRPDVGIIAFNISH